MWFYKRKTNVYRVTRFLVYLTADSRVKPWFPFNVSMNTRSRCVRWRRKSGCREEEKSSRSRIRRRLHALSRCAVHEHTGRSECTLHYFDAVKPTSRPLKRWTLVKAERKPKKKEVFNESGNVPWSCIAISCNSEPRNEYKGMPSSAEICEKIFTRMFVNIDANNISVKIIKVWSTL